MTDQDNSLTNGIPQRLYDLSNDFMNLDNASFLAAVRDKLDGLDETGFNLENDRTFKNGMLGAMCLMGEYGPIGYSVREALTIINTDNKPSFWSHTFLIKDEISKAVSDNQSSQIWESTMDISGKFPNIKLINGVHTRNIMDYNDIEYSSLQEHRVPNLAVIIFALNKTEVQAVLSKAQDPTIDSLKYDFSGLIGTWLAYLLKTQNKENILSAGNAIYCSAFCQLVYDAVNIKLAPNIDWKNLSAENVWNALNGGYQPEGHPSIAFYCIRDKVCKL